MKLILCRNRSIGSWFLRAAMWSRWSHAAVYDERDGIVYDSTFWQGGVKSHFYTDFCERYPQREIRDLTPEVTDSSARYWLAAQIDKPYDWTALLSFVVHRNWQDPDSWFCSELAESVRDQFGVPRFRAAVSRITPLHQDMVV